MSVGRKARRERISAAFDTFHATVRDLLTAATRLSEGAAREHAETMVEFWLRREGLESARTDPGLQGVLANPRSRRRWTGSPPTRPPPSTSGSPTAPTGSSP